MTEDAGTPPEEQAAPAETPAPAVAETAPPAASGEAKTETLAIISLIAGILSLIVSFCCGFLGFPFPIAAIILGLISLSKIKKDPENLKGKGLAIGGIICGAVGIVLLVLAIILFGAGQIIQMANQ